MPSIRPSPSRRLSPASGLTAALLGAAVLAALLGFASHPAPTEAQIPLDRFESACEARSDNPWLATTCFQRGTAYDSEPAIVAFHDTADDSDHIPLATAGEIGSVYGLAYHGPSATLYAAAYQKRGTHFGPAGPGGIYAIDLNDGSIATFATVPDAGTDAHSDEGDYYPDTPARFAAGRNSLGDLELSPDGTEMAVMNLNDRRIHRFSVPGGAHLGSFAHGATDEPWANDARPFGLGYAGDQLLHGVVNSAQSTGNPDDLEAIVYASARDGAGMRRVASSGLRYERGDTWRGEGAAIWNPWQDPAPSKHPRHGRYPMPLVSDFDLADSEGQLVVGMRDRFGDTTFYSFAPTPPPPGERTNNVPAGDILPAFPQDDGWRLVVEPEHYSGDSGPGPNGGHDETSFGGLAVIPWLDRVVVSANSPLRVNSAGILWLDISSGESVAREEIYSLGADNFGKANGLGDVELLCNLQEATPTPTAPPTETAAPSETPVPTGTETPAPTTTPLPSETSVPSITPTGFVPSATPPPTSTDVPPEGDEAPPPTATVLPKLPPTGRADGPGLPTLAAWLLGAAALLLITVRRIRRPEQR